MLFCKLMNLLRTKVVVACTLLRPTLLLAEIARHSPGSRMCPVWVGNVSFTVACPNTCSLLTAQAAFANTTFRTLNLLIRRTCLRGCMDSNTFPSGGTESVSSASTLPFRFCFEQLHTIEVTILLDTTGNPADFESSPDNHPLL